jgi:hypothetical protein
MAAHARHAAAFNFDIGAEDSRSGRIKAVHEIFASMKPPAIRRELDMPRLLGH